MKYESYIALRYLLSKKSLKFVSIISAISVIGVTIGVAALIIVLSVFNGFGSLVSSILINFDPHLRIEKNYSTEDINYDELSTFLETCKYVKGYSPFVAGKALIVSKNVNRVVNIRGLDEEKIHAVSGLKEKIVLGSIDTEMKKGNNIVIGLVLADRLGAVVGDTISIVSPSGAEFSAMQHTLPLIRRFRIIGIYESNNKEYDGYYAITNLKSGQSLFGKINRVDGIDVRCNNLEETSRLEEELQNKFGDTYRYLTWYDLHKELYSIMQIEKWGAYIVLLLIIAVASFNLLSSLTMIVIEKKRDIGILKSMGATDKSLKKIFKYQGLFVGLIGTLMGTVLGILIVYLQEKFHLVALDTSVYIIPAMPVELYILDILIIAVAAIGLCTMASILPSKRAANLDPVRAIQWE